MGDLNCRTCGKPLYNCECESGNRMRILMESLPTRPTLSSLSAELANQDSELTRLRAELEVERRRVATLAEALRVAKVACEGIFNYSDRAACLQQIEAATVEVPE